VAPRQALFVMNPIPFIPPNAPFSKEQLHWLNGYLAGFFSNAAGAASMTMEAGGEAGAKVPLTLLWGSQTGTAEGLAKRFAKEANTRGFDAKVADLGAYPVGKLATERNLIVLTSTYGDGEPPDNAAGFWSALKDEAAPRLESLRYSVLALGDTNYAGFCQFGKDCDERLLALGASRVFARTDCDIDYEEPAKQWLAGALSAFSEGSTAAVPALQTAAAGDEPVVLEGYNRKNPFAARLLVNRTLNGAGSGKEVRHYEISLAGSGLVYEAGDALGVYPENCPDSVSEILALMGWDGEEAVTVAGSPESSLRVALLRSCDITRPSTEMLKALAERGSGGGELLSLLDPARKDDLKAFLWGREVVDLLAGLNGALTPGEFVGLLKKLQPRLYSISSSPNAHPDEVHLTVAAVRYEGHGKKRKGVCSTFLADRVSSETPVPVFVQVSHGFRLPANGELPVIMCGPGTGIAPFRAFLEERQVSGATGKNWLFFGDQKRDTDFLYREQLEGWVAGGHLTRLDLAFSRDQAEKIYVQNRILENAEELWAWFQAGAHFYVCGDASRMAKDVDAALVKVAETAGGLSAEAAADYIQKLKTEKRYQRDVY
jgi:sulfite reductase (NADPH) flavoprotein alpha-component